MFVYKNILVLSDNVAILTELIQYLGETKDYPGVQFSFCTTSEKIRSEVELKIGGNKIKRFIFDESIPYIINNFDLIFSAHCKRIFPPQLVKNKKCINIHPGYNPYNRGWFPQVFSIINKKKCGATLHEIDEELDHGPIIVRSEVEINSEDTSFSVYQRIVALEMSLFKKWLPSILKNTYFAFPPTEQDGSLNLKAHFNELCHLNLSEVATYGQVIDRLRALTFGEYKNAYFIDPKSGEKVFVKVELTREPQQEIKNK